MATTPREALEAFSHRVHAEFESWYDCHSTNCYRWYLVLQLLVFISSLAVAVIAALSNGADYEKWAKYLIVTLPLVTALANTVLIQLRLYDLWKLREEGRIQVQAIALEAVRRAASAKTDEDCSRIHEELEQRLNQIESSQGASFFGLYKAGLVLELKK
jgi:hypothetical protein